MRVPTYCDGFELTKSAFNALIRTYPEFKGFVASVASLREQANQERAHRSSSLTGGSLSERSSNGRPSASSFTRRVSDTRRGSCRILQRINTHRAHQVLASVQARDAKKGKKTRRSTIQGGTHNPHGCQSV